MHTHPAHQCRDRDAKVTRGCHPPPWITSASRSSPPERNAPAIPKGPASADVVCHHSHTSLTQHTHPPTQTMSTADDERTRRLAAIEARLNPQRDTVADASAPGAGTPGSAGSAGAASSGTSTPLFGSNNGPPRNLPKAWKRPTAREELERRREVARILNRTIVRDSGYRQAAECVEVSRHGVEAAEEGGEGRCGGGQLRLWLHEGRSRRPWRWLLVILMSTTHLSLCNYDAVNTHFPNAYRDCPKPTRTYASRHSSRLRPISKARARRSSAPLRVTTRFSRTKCSQCPVAGSIWSL